MKSKVNQGGEKRENEPDNNTRFNRYDVSSRKKPVFVNDSMNFAKNGEKGNDLCFSMD